MAEREPPDALPLDKASQAARIILEAHAEGRFNPEQWAALIKMVFELLRLLGVFSDE